LLQTPLKKQWEKIGLERKAGVVFPLFSIFSKKSAGIGEIPDLKLAVDWCRLTGHKILQVLPLNDTGFLASPFSPHSSIALNPIHLSISELRGAVNTTRQVKRLRKEFPTSGRLVDYRMGEKKIGLLRSLFRESLSDDGEFRRFLKENRHWVRDYALFRALKSHYGEKPWELWDPSYRERKKSALEFFEKKNAGEIFFWQWIQWQLFEQLKDVRKYADKKSVLMKGDLPFLVSKDSADCWANQKYFKMHLSAGSPPDEFSREGQYWNMPPYNWSEILKDNFTYFKQKLKYAENFYRMFRLDHIVGFFRIWSLSEKEKFFDPKNEKTQKQRGREILELIIKNTEMLPCAEDLGTVPLFCRETLRDLGIPGLDVARNQKDYRELAVSTLSTHDLNLYPAWLQNQGREVNGKIIRENLELVSSSPGIFNILLVFEWLFLDETIKKEEALSYEINDPSKDRPENWKIRLPLSIEDLIESPLNRKIKEINEGGGRC